MAQQFEPMKYDISWQGVAAYYEKMFGKIYERLRTPVLPLLPECICQLPHGIRPEPDLNLTPEQDEIARKLVGG